MRLVPVDKAPRVRRETVSIFPSQTAGVAVVSLVALLSFLAGAICAFVLQQGTCQYMHSAALWNPIAAFRSVQSAAMNPVLALLSPQMSLQAGLATTAATSALTVGTTWAVKKAGRRILSEGE